MLDIAEELIKNNLARCYKKNKYDKLYSFLLYVNNKWIYTDFDFNRYVGVKYTLTVKQLREVKRWLRIKCDLVNLDDYIENVIENVIET